MFEDSAEKLVKKIKADIKKTFANDTSYHAQMVAKILKNADIAFEDTSGCANSTMGSITMPIQRQYLEKNNIKENVAFSYIFAHELGHLVLNFINLNEKDLTAGLEGWEKNKEEYEKYGYEYTLGLNYHMQKTPEYFYHDSVLENFAKKLKNSNIYNSDDIKDDELADIFNNFQEVSFDIENAETQRSLTQYSIQMRGVLHECFAECFSVGIMKNILPKDYDNFQQQILKERALAQNSYADYFDNEAENGQSSHLYVHRIAGALSEMVENIQSNAQCVKSLDDIINQSFSIAKKHCVLEMKEVMVRDKNVVFYNQSGLDDWLNQRVELTPDKINVVDKMKSIRENALNRNANTDLTYPK